jgi:hypothetical protein
MKTRTLLSLTLILAALTFMALLKHNAELAMGLAGSTLLLCVGSLTLELISYRRGAKEAQAALERSARLETAERELKQLEEAVKSRDQKNQELHQLLRNAERLQETMQAEADQQLARNKRAEAELQALRAQKIQAEAHQSKDATDTAVLQFLRHLQERGRLLDFAMADIHKLPDAQVGAAARVVQNGVKAVLSDYFEIKPIREESEGTVVAIPEDVSERQRFRILGGDVSETGVSQGRLLHKGWEAMTIRLPQTMPRAGASSRIIAPAEVEMRGA